MFSTKGNTMANSIKLSLKIIPFLVVIATIGGLGDAVDPGATKCWNFKVGRFMTQGGSNEREEIKECSGNQYCYIGKISGDDNNKQGLHATRWQFQGGCVSEGHEIFEHPGIDKENMPSCSIEKHSNLDFVCVCNTDECNGKVLYHIAIQGLVYVATYFAINFIMIIKFLHFHF